MSAKICQNACLTSSWAWVGTLASRLRARCTRQRCRSDCENTTSTAPISPGAPSVMTSSGARSPRSTSSPKNPAQGSWPSSLPVASPSSTGVPLEVRGVQEQVVQLDPLKVAGLPGVELLLDHLADPVDRRLGQRRLRTERLPQRRLDIADAQAANEPGDDEGLQRVGAADALAQQPGRKWLWGAAQLGALQHDRARGGLDLDRLVAVAQPRSDALTTLVAVPAKELGHLGLKCGLDDQPHAQPGHILQDPAEVLLGREQLVDLGADALHRRYSWRHGRRPPVRVVSSVGSLRPFHFSTRLGTPPQR